MAYEIYFPFWMNNSSEILLDKEIEVQGEAFEVEMYKSEDLSVQEGDRGYFLSIRGFQTIEKRNKYFQDLWLVLYLVCLELRLTPRPSSRPSKRAYVGKDYLEFLEKDFTEKHLRGEMPRIDRAIDAAHPAIFPEDTAFCPVSTSLSSSAGDFVSRSPQEFTQLFLENLESIDIEGENPIKEKILKATELYHFAFYGYQNSPSAKYVALITVMEMLSEKKRYSEGIQEIEKKCQELKKELIAKRKSYLENIRYSRFSQDWYRQMPEYQELIQYEKSSHSNTEQSITSAVEDLARASLEASCNERKNELIESISKIYKRRSKIVHEDAMNFKHIIDLEVIVREVLLYKSSLLWV